MVNALNNIEEKIIKELQKDNNRFVNKTTLSKSLGISFVTISKYVDVMEAKNLLEVQKFGNNKLIKNLPWL